MKILGVSSGNGVMLYPFMKEHIVIGNIETRSVFYSPGNKQWELNFPGIPMEKTDEFVRDIQVDVIVGHPDCGSGSVLRLSRAKENVPYADNVSLNIFFKSVTKFNPKYFILENLPAFGKEFPKRKLMEILPDYYFVYLEGSVAHWGNSQKSRKRLVIMGVRKDLGKGTLIHLKLPKIKEGKLHTCEYFEMSREEQEDVCHIREPQSKTCNLILGDRKIITYREAKHQWLLREDTSRWHVGGKMNNQPGVTRNLHGGFPTTMRKQNRQFSIKGDVLSPREMANIQGVPKSFKLYWSGDEKKRIYDINKARTTVTKTPPYEIGKWFCKKLNKIQKEYGTN